MIYTKDLVISTPYSSRVTTTSSHPQLRDLLAFTPSTSPSSSSSSSSYDNSISVITYDSLASHTLYNDRRPHYTPLNFSPCCITYGCGFVAVGGQNSEIALKSSSNENKDWCQQYTPHSGSANSAIPQGSIVNSLNISSKSPSEPDQPRLLASSNDEKLLVYDIVACSSEEGAGLPDWRGARRRREREKKRFRQSLVESSWEAEEWQRRKLGGENEEFNHGDQEEEEDLVEESPTFNPSSGPCQLLPRPELDIPFSTPINHCSLSRDGTKMLAVGDTEEVWMFEVRGNGEYQLVASFGNGESRDASFSTDWDESGNAFVVGSQDGFVNVYDPRFLSTSSSASSSRHPPTVASLRTTQRGPAGAVRKVKFSPGGRGKIDGGLLAFTEHRNLVHIVDSRTFSSTQLLEIPRYPTQNDTPSNSVFLVNEPLLVPQLDHFESGSIPPRTRPLPLRRRRRRSSSTQPRLDEPIPQARRTRFPSSGSDGILHLIPDPQPRIRRRVDSGTTPREVTMTLPDEGRGEVWPVPVLPRGAGESVGGMQIRNRRVTHQDDPEEETENEEDGAEVGWNEQQDLTDEEEESEDEEEEEDQDEDEESEQDLAEASWNNPATSQTTQESRIAEVASLAGVSLPSRTYSSVAATSNPQTRHSWFPGGLTPTSPHPPSSSRTARDIPYSTLTRFTTSPSSSNPSLPTLSLFAAPLINPSRSSTPSFYPSTNLSRQPRVIPSQQSYRSNSNNFPLDTSERDLLGLDWDEWGERVLVATSQRVWEWDVDVKSRRGKGSFDYC